MLSSKTFRASARFIRLLALPLLWAGSLLAADPNSPFVGRWALTTPEGAAGWLGITADNNYYDGSLLWVAGSVEPVDSVYVAEDTLWVIRIHSIQRKDSAGKVVRTQRYPEALMAKVNGDELSLTRLVPRENGEGVDAQEFTGKRTPPVPPAPNLSALKFGEPVTLFNGRDLDGWRLTSPKDANGWVVEQGLLINRPLRGSGRPRVSYGNLRTDREFEDFNLKLEAKVPKDGNSGVYLHGIYEVQVADTYGRSPDPHNTGAIYSRITPSASVEKPPGEWQTFDITLCDRHATVILNGVKIIDNQPLLGCTGGALWSDEMRPGPIYLQGDHAGVEYRNIVLRPILK